MLTIRLRRVGKKHDPSFKVVVVDSRKSAKAGSFIEVVGTYNAQRGEPKIDGEKVKGWIAKGAQVSDTVHNLLVKSNILSGKKIDVLHHTKIKAKLAKKAPKVEEVKVEAPKEAPKAEEVKVEETKVEEAVPEEVKPEEVAG